jgi:hypothetical protein
MGEVLTMHRVIGIGFCNFHISRRMKFPGWPLRRRGLLSWAHHGDDGSFFTSSKQLPVARGKPWNVGDTVGCGIDYDTNTIFFTRQGVKLGTCEAQTFRRYEIPKNGQAKTALDTQFNDAKGRLFPCLGFGDNDICIEVNFGNNLLEKPFAWPEGKKSHTMEV